ERTPVGDCLSGSSLLLLANLPIHGLLMRSVIETLIREGTLLCLFFLPKERRIAIERRIRGRFEWQKLRACDVIIVSFGKSGRTWLRVMMSRLYQKRYGLPERMLLQYDNMHRRNSAVPKIHY